MADLARLNLAIESKDAKKARERLEKLRKAALRTNLEARKLHGQSRGLVGVAKRIATAFMRTARAMQSFARTMTSVRGIMGTLLAGAAVAKLIDYADAWKNAGNMLRLVTSSTEEAAFMQQKLFDIAQKNRVGFESTAQLYFRMARATQQLNIGQGDLLDITQAVVQSGIIGGATTHEMNAAILQLSQGLASLELRGEEFRSVQEQLPRLAIALAAGMDIDFGALREQAHQGNLTTVEVLKATLDQMHELQEEFDKIKPTIGQGLMRIQNSLLRFVGVGGEVSGVADALATVFIKVSDAIDRMADRMEPLGFLIKQLVKDRNMWVTFAEDNRDPESGMITTKVGTAMTSYASDLIQHLLRLWADNITQFARILGAILSLALNHALPFIKQVVTDVVNLALYLIKQALPRVYGWMITVTSDGLFKGLAEEDELKTIKEASLAMFENAKAATTHAGWLLDQFTLIGQAIAEANGEGKKFNKTLERVGKDGIRSIENADRMLRTAIETLKNLRGELELDLFEAGTKTSMLSSNFTEQQVKDFLEAERVMRQAREQLTEKGVDPTSEAGKAALTELWTLYSQVKAEQRAADDLAKDLQIKATKQNIEADLLRDIENTRMQLELLRTGSSLEEVENALERTKALHEITNDLIKQGLDPETAKAYANEVEKLIIQQQQYNAELDKAKKRAEEEVAISDAKIGIEANLQRAIANTRKELELLQSGDSLREVELALDRIRAMQDISDDLIQRGMDPEAARKYAAELEHVIELHQQMREEVERVRQQRTEIESMGQAVGDAFGSAFESAIFEAKKFSDVLEGLFQDISRIIFRQLVLNTLVGNAAAGTGIAGVATGFLQSLIPGAGAAPVAHADGGVVNRATLFPMSSGRLGLMGEAGPEAILPLTRGPGGKLGVHAQGGQSTVINQNITITTPDASSFRKSRMQIANELRSVGRRAGG